MDAEDIKRQYSMAEVCRMYGYTPNRAGYICCPWHNEKTASCKIYKNSFHCYGCGVDGDIFDFVEKMENCDFKTAFKMLGGQYTHRSDSDRLRAYRRNKAKEYRDTKEKTLREALRARQDDVADYRHALDVLGEKSPLYSAALAQYEAARERAEEAEEKYLNFKERGDGS